MSLYTTMKRINGIFLQLYHDNNYLDIQHIILVDFIVNIHANKYYTLLQRKIEEINLYLIIFM